MTPIACKHKGKVPGHDKLGRLVSLHPLSDSYKSCVLWKSKGGEERYAFVSVDFSREFKSAMSLHCCAWPLAFGQTCHASRQHVPISLVAEWK